MPSFQLFEVKEQFNIQQLEQEDLLTKVKARNDDSQNLKNFIENSKKKHRNLTFSKDKKGNIIKMNFDEYRQFQDKQTIWINLEKLIIKHNQLLLIGKTGGKIERLVQLYLRDIADSKPIVFNDKQLWQIWKKIVSKAVQEDLETKLHRLIMKNTFIEADKFNELNLHSNDLSNLGIITELVKQAERINAITIKIRGFYADKKWMTIRIDKNGSLLIYGKHNTNIIVKFLELFIQSL